MSALVSSNTARPTCMYFIFIFYVADLLPCSLRWHAAISPAHQAHAAKTLDSNNELAEAMFRGYFTDGVFPDRDNLVKAAAAAGMDADAARQVLTDDAAILAVQNELATWRSYTSSVPMFIVNGVPAFSGAQEKEVRLALGVMLTGG